MVQGQPVTTSGNGGVAWPVRCDGTAVLVLGDLGTAEAPGGTTGLWAALGKAARDAGGRVFALGLLPQRLAARPMPAPWQTWQVHAQRVGPSPRIAPAMAAASALHMVPSTAAPNGGNQTPGGQPQPPHNHSPAEPSPPTAQQALVAALLGNADVNARLLRSLRLALQQGGFKLDVGHEVELWHSMWVQSDSRACQLTLAGAEQARLWWQQLPAPLRNELCAVHWRHLQAGSPLLCAEYALALQGALEPGCTMEATLAAGRQAGEQLMRQAAALQWQAADGAGPAGLGADLQDFFRAQCHQQPGLLRQADDGADAQQGWQWAWALAHRQQWPLCAEGTPPPWLGTGLAAVVAQPPQPAHPMALELQLTAGFCGARLVLKAQSASNAALLAGLAAVRARVLVHPPERPLALSLALAQLPQEQWHTLLGSLLAMAFEPEDEALQAVRRAVEPILLSCPSRKCSKHRLGAGLGQILGGT